MDDWLLGLPVVWMGALVLGAVYLFTAGLYAVVTTLAVGERARAFKAISPGMLPPLAIIFALLVGFLAAQDWNESEHASAAVNREASALRAIVLLAREFPGEPEARLHRLVRGYIEHAVGEEWPAMARQDASIAIAPAPLVEALRLILSLPTHGEGHAIAQRQMIASLESVLDARRQRIIISRASINWVKWAVLLVQAALTLVTIAMIHADNRLANRIILAVFATGIGVSLVLIASHSRPFTGELSVDPGVLLQVMPEPGPDPE